MSSKRLFFAIDLPLEIKEKILKIAKKINLPKEASLTPMQNLHLTILFLGDIAIENIPQILKISQKVFSHYQPFDLYFNDITAIPNKNYCRMIWLNGEYDKTFKQIKNELEQELEKEKIAFQKENHKLKIHITLARFLPQKLDFQTISLPIHLKIKEIILMESELKKPHAIYIPLEKFILKGENKI